MPDLAGPVVTQNPHNPGPNGPNTYFLPDAFVSGPSGAFGDANRRFFHGPAIVNTDLGLSKRIPLTDSLFGVVASARDPRIGQVSAKFAW